MFGIPVRVYFQDTDAAGVVFHATYLDFMERARIEWLRSKGFEPAELARRFGLVIESILEVEVGEGDQVGEMSIARWFVSRMTLVPSRLATYSSELPSRVDIKAMRVPSGDHAGRKLFAVFLVSSSSVP